LEKVLLDWSICIAGIVLELSLKISHQWDWRTFCAHYLFAALAAPIMNYCSSW
jgi:hypothetical protein